MWASRHEAAHSVDTLTWISSPSGNANAIAGMKTHEKNTEHHPLNKTKHQFLYLRSFHAISLLSEAGAMEISDLFACLVLFGSWFHFRH